MKACPHNIDMENFSPCLLHPFTGYSCAGSMAALRFGSDGRLVRAAHLLCSSRPLALQCSKLLATRDVDPDAPAKIQQQVGHAEVWHDVWVV